MTRQSFAPLRSTLLATGAAALLGTGALLVGATTSGAADVGTDHDLAHRFVDADGHGQSHPDGDGHPGAAVLLRPGADDRRHPR